MHTGQKNSTRKFYFKPYSSYNPSFHAMQNVFISCTTLTAELASRAGRCEVLKYCVAIPMHTTRRSACAILHEVGDRQIIFQEVK